MLVLLGLGFGLWLLPWIWCLGELGVCCGRLLVDSGWGVGVWLVAGAFGFGFDCD